MNALMLPVVLGFLVLLAFKALPPEHRMRGATPGSSSGCRFSPPGSASMAASRARLRPDTLHDVWDRYFAVSLPELPFAGLGGGMAGTNSQLSSHPVSYG